MTGQLETRASDEERQLVIERLREETTAGRLTLEEFDERVGEVWTAKTRGELQHALRELPDPVPTGSEQASGSEPPGFEQKVRRRYRSAVRNDLAGFVSANAFFGTIWLVIRVAASDTSSASVAVTAGRLMTSAIVRTLASAICPPWLDGTAPTSTLPAAQRLSAGSSRSRSMAGGAWDGRGGEVTA